MRCDVAIHRNWIITWSCKLLIGVEDLRTAKMHFTKRVRYVGQLIPNWSKEKLSTYKLQLSCRGIKSLEMKLFLFELIKKEIKLIINTSADHN